MPPKKSTKGKKHDDGFGDEDADEHRLEEKMKKLMSDQNGFTKEVLRLRPAVIVSSSSSSSSSLSASEVRPKAFRLFLALSISV
jgi:hypothetical protein